MAPLTLLNVEGVPLRAISVLEDASYPFDQDTHAILVLADRDDPVLDFVRLETPTVALIVPRQVPGTGLSLVASIPATRWFLGHNATVQVIDWRVPRVVAKAELVAPVYSLRIVAPDEAVAVHEIGACRFNADGGILWRYDADVVIQHALWSDRLFLRGMDGSEVALNLDTGQPVPLY